LQQLEQRMQLAWRLNVRRRLPALREENQVVPTVRCLQFIRIHVANHWLIRHPVFFVYAFALCVRIVAPRYQRANNDGEEREPLSTLDEEAKRIAFACNNVLSLGECVAVTFCMFLFIGVINQYLFQYYWECTDFSTTENVLISALLGMY
jgi:hypothetical protein